MACINCMPTNQLKYMTTKEYVLKYNLSNSNKFNHLDFCKDLASEFICLLEYNKADNNIKGFDNAVRCIRMKFDAISNKTLGVFPEKLWNYFFATVIVKLREEMCKVEMEQRRILSEKKKKDWEEREERRKFADGFWDRSFFHFLFDMVHREKPVDDFAVLGLSGNASASDVKTAYRELSMKHHPDKGGKQEHFIKLTDSKNKCLSWLEV